MKTSPQYEVIVSGCVKQTLATHIEFITQMDVAAAQKAKQTKMQFVFYKQS